MLVAEKRFWSKVDKSGPCWLWNAAKDKNGYGFFKLDGKLRKSHRKRIESKGVSLLEVSEWARPRWT